jgi:hypothetical protein
MLVAPTRNPSNFVRYKSTELKGVVTQPNSPTNGAGTSEGDIHLVPDHGTRYIRVIPALVTNLRVDYIPTIAPTPLCQSPPKSVGQTNLLM